MPRATATATRPGTLTREQRLVVALTAAGVATFAQLYSVQAVLPALADDLATSAAHAALGVSVATGALALSVLAWSAVADRVGRVPAMVASTVLATAVGLAVPLAHDLTPLLVLRAVQGAALGGLPAVATAHLADQLRPADVPRAAAACVAGTTVGGLLGRVVSATATDVGGGWRWGVAAAAVLSALATAVFCAAVPRGPGPHTAPRTPARSGGPRLHVRLRGALTDPGLLVLYAQALLLMGAFVTVYNYLGFRLLRAPFELSQTAVGLLFVVYLAGTASSQVAGRLVARTSALAVLLASVAVLAAGALLTLSSSVPVVLVGLTALTAGFFGAHATANGWVGGRAAAPVRSQASALYTFAYYLGSSVLGWVGGFAFVAGGWGGVVALVVALGALAAALAVVGLRTPRPA